MVLNLLTAPPPLPSPITPIRTVGIGLQRNPNTDFPLEGGLSSSNVLTTSDLELTCPILSNLLPSTAALPAKDFLKNCLLFNDIACILFET